MTIAYLKRFPGGFAIDEVANEPNAFKGVSVGQIIKVDFTAKPMNLKFFRKFFALLQIGFDAFEPNTTYKGVAVEKNFNQFREDVIIQAGFYTVTSDLNGRIRLKADSISWAKMKPEDFDDLYNKSVNVVLQKVLTNYTRADLDHVVEQVIRF